MILLSGAPRQLLRIYLLGTSMNKGLRTPSVRYMEPLRGGVSPARDMMRPSRVRRQLRRTPLGRTPEKSSLTNFLERRRGTVRKNSETPVTQLRGTETVLFGSFWPSYTTTLRSECYPHPFLDSLRRGILGMWRCALS